MARTVQEIQDQIIEEVQSNATLAPLLTSPSVVAIWRLWTFVQATTIAFFEQILDVNTADLEQIALEAVASTEAWWNAKALQFQYSATDPQIVVLDPDTLQIAYPVINEELQIITASSIVATGFKNSIIKVAKGDITDLQPLDSQEKSAFVAYLDTISPVGNVPEVLSESSDLAKIGCEIYYNGQYNESDVQADAIEAVQTYFQNLDFNGNVQLNKIIDAIQAVNGVNDVVLNDVVIRDYTQIFGEGQILVSGNDWLQRIVTTTAGYVKEETESGEGFADTFIMINSNA